MVYKKCSLVLIVVIALGIITGCSRRKDYGLDPKRPTTLTIWNYYNGAQKDEFDKLIQKFNETLGSEKGIVLQALSQGSISTLNQALLDAAQHNVGASEMPDLFASYADTAYELNQMGLLADYSKYLTESEIDEYFDSYIYEGQLEEEQSYKLFPIAKSTDVLVLNKTDWDKFAKATHTTDAGFATWEGIAKIAEEYYKWTDSLTPEPDDGKAFFGRDSFANYMLIGNKELGCEFFEVQDGKVTFNIDETIMRKLWDYYYVPFINGYFASQGRFGSDDVKTGEIVACVGSTSGVAYFPTEVTREDGSSYPIESEVYLIPRFEGSDKYAVQQGAGMAICASEEKKEYAATIFLKWFTEKDINTEFSIYTGYLPVKKEANTIENIEAAFNNSQEETNELLRKTVLIGIELMKNYKLYTAKAFENAYEARAYVDSAMQIKAASDLEKINQLVTNGESRANAVAKFNTEENFQVWFRNFRIELNAIK